MDSVAVLCFDGFDELDAIGPYEVFQTAIKCGAEWEVSVRTVSEESIVRGSHGLRIEPDGPLTAVSPDLVVVPGGGWNDRDDAGAWAEAERGDLPATLATAYESGVAVAGVCTGGMILAEAGLLNGRPAVTHHGALDDLRATDAEVVDARVVDDDDVLTSGGVTAGLDLAVHLVEREWGSAVADSVIAEMEYEPRGPIHQSG